MDMFWFFPLLFSIFAAPGSAQKSPPFPHTLASMTELVKNLVSLGNTELNFVSDFTDPVQSGVLNNLNEMGIPQYVYEIDGWRYKQTHIPEEPCPIFGEGITKIYSSHK